MSLSVHHAVLLAVFAVALVMGATANKTRFCAMGAVSDWINMGDTGRLRAWLLASAVALTGVLLLEASGAIDLDAGTFPPYRSVNFAWLRYLLGGLMFGAGMTFASGCVDRTLVKIGGGSLKSLFVLAVAAACAYLMMWTEFYEKAFNGWIVASSLSLGRFGIESQEIGALFAGLFGIAQSRTTHLVIGALIALGLLVWLFASQEFRRNRDNVLGGMVIGLAVVAGWYLTGGPLGQAWKEWAEMAAQVPSRVEVQSFTFISPMGDLVRYLLHPTQLAHINFGIVALAGVIAGSLLYALFTRNFRVEWFSSVTDFFYHLVGAALMGVGGVLAMGCTIGQAVTGVSTLALGSFLTFAALIAGAAAAMKYQYWRA